ncbi:aldehyde dehydrogenase family protein [Ligilactobacillus ruminis]|uniref:aldehyde dehydrogenase family protein n=1 Tax=Ligilactobacillus ruminis TaxID=1623 RepID=UPI003F9920A5
MLGDLIIPGRRALGSLFFINLHHYTGITGAVCSKDAERAKKVELAIETGKIFINQPSSAHPELPFGGIKNSGFGREMSKIGLFEFANEKIVVD